MMMGRICVFLLLGMFCLPAGAQAVDFKIKGQWWMGFTAWESDLIYKTRDGARENKRAGKDKFDPLQRMRLQLEAVASENLSGMLQIQIGNQRWGKAADGGALGADGKNVIKVRWAYLDWMAPDTSIKVRMGIQPVTLPNKAGGPAVLDSRATGIVASWKACDNAGITAMWLRPSNDNYAGDNGRQAGYLDNLDLFGLTIPLKFENFEITPWALYGILGRNTFKDGNNWTEGDPFFSFRPYFGTPGNEWPVGGTSKTYGSVFWAGLPLQLAINDALNIEFDFNYGYVEEMGRYTAFKGIEQIAKRGSTKREGWLAKALVEYKFDWGVPGIFGWYASGDDGNVKNGSERMPAIVPYGNFTSFMGDGNLAWAWQDYQTSYAGTWGIGLQVRDVSFIEDLEHTFRLAWWGGTNNTNMVKYMGKSYSWDYGSRNFDGPYMTTNDGFLEFNLVNNYKMYENFNINLELGYIANHMDNDTWKKAGTRDSSFSKQDIWKIQLGFLYDF